MPVCRNQFCTALVSLPWTQCPGEGMNWSAYRVYPDPADLLEHMDEVGVRVGE
jgi:hypothetical protein